MTEDAYHMDQRFKIVRDGSIEVLDNNQVEFIKMLLHLLACKLKCEYSPKKQIIYNIACVILAKKGRHEHNERKRKAGRWGNNNCV